jgi:hypothetical protein
MEFVAQMLMPIALMVVAVLIVNAIPPVFKFVVSLF